MSGLKDYLTIREASDQLGMSTDTTVMDHIRRGKLHAVRMGRQYLVLRADIEKFIVARKARYGRVKIHAGGPGVPRARSKSDVNGFQLPRRVTARQIKSRQGSSASSAG